MKFVTVTDAIRRINWRRRYKRGFDAGALTLFLGPPLGGLALGIIDDVNLIILASRGQLTGNLPPTFVEMLWLSFLLPIGTAFAALLLPGAWLAAATAALYVAARVGVTGRMSWAETIVLAVLCSMLPGVRYQMGSALVFLTCSLCAALALRYLAGQLGLAR